MSLSSYARLLLIGIWTEAFDDGVFEWKPLTLKARIFPVDNVEVNDLLLELVHANLIARMDAHPKRPGVIRNFQRYQRPKKPNKSHMMCEEWLDYVGAKAAQEPSDDDGSEALENQFGTGPEKSPQMEDGGGKGNSSLRSESIEKKERERADFDSWISSWPSQASDDHDDAFRAWSELSDEDRAAAKRLSSAYVEQAKGGGRTVICSAAKYLRQRMWKRVQSKKPPDKPPKLDAAALEAKASAARAAHIAAELRRSERSFQR